MKMNDEIKEVIEDIFSANDVTTIQDMLDVITQDLDKKNKPKRLSRLRDIINERIR